MLSRCSLAKGSLLDDNPSEGGAAPVHPPVIAREGLPSLMILSAHPPRKVRSSALSYLRATYYRGHGIHVNSSCISNTPGTCCCVLHHAC